MSGGKSESNKKSFSENISNSESSGSSRSDTFIDRGQSPFLQFLRSQGQGLAQNQLGRRSGFQNDVLDPSIGAFNELLGGPQDFKQNPFLQGQIEQGQGMLNRNLQENLLPGISSGAAGAGQLGSSRQGVAEGIALRGTQEAGADFAQNLISEDFSRQSQQRDNASQRQLAALGLAPGIGGLAFSPLQNLQQLIGGPTVLSRARGEDSSVSSGIGTSKGKGGSQGKSLGFK